ncbi:hypothetical protein Acr_15g0003080 [Actinidia rufa]|uniref:Uncharacterized protein n=1 Tax=Actinidia rufa TaxID=165716 RepID=A0A7J0FSL7_9ERIC|nr:hypothetical protein Acr_15g0003080 [Actinidia rufa]
MGRTGGTPVRGHAVLRVVVKQPKCPHVCLGDYSLYNFESAMDESKQRIEALEEEAEKMMDDDERGEDEESDEIDDDDDGEGEVGEEKRRQVRVLAQIEAKLLGSKSETLASNSSSLQFSESDLSSYFAISSHLLSEVLVDYALLLPLESRNFKVRSELSFLAFVFDALFDDHTSLDSFC